MSYQVLARKWRPRSFEDMVGQAHVVRALSNALERDMLHHAYLFTGTRGVGKTTLARILSKALNCEQGVSARPCGQCSACREIDEGRFIDLLEVDAASRTKVDQTRELLDNVAFAPVKGRFKVYLIDEVHMFSGHSFNALLKTLEEPPPHVKFLLATTDPQKVPVTVLSRCLQFNLKRLLPEEIQRQLDHIVRAEGMEAEDQALALLARAADGSMRDGLSLLDQAIAFCGGRVAADQVRTMLGTVGRDLSLDLVESLADLDAPRTLDEVARIAELTPDFAGVLQELLLILHRIALLQQVPGTLPDEDPERERLLALGQRMAPEDVQLFYQVALTGQQDLPLAPDPRSGIEMVLLRMLAFRPDTASEPKEAVGSHGGGRQAALADEVSRGGVAEDRAGQSVVTKSSGPFASVAGAESPAAAALAAARRATSADGPPTTHNPPTRAQTKPPRASRFVAEGVGTPKGIRVTETRAGYTQAAVVVEPDVPALADSEDWHDLVRGLGQGGVMGQLAANCSLAGWDGQKLTLSLDPECRNLLVAGAEERLRGALALALGEGLRLEIQVSPPEDETPARRRARQSAERQAQAELQMEQDPVARALQDELGAIWVPGTIRPAS